MKKSFTLFALLVAIVTGAWAGSETLTLAKGVSLTSCSHFNVTLGTNVTQSSDNGRINLAKDTEGSWTIATKKTGEVLTGITFSWKATPNATATTATVTSGTWSKGSANYDTWTAPDGNSTTTVTFTFEDAKDISIQGITVTYGAAAGYPEITTQPTGGIYFKDASQSLTVGAEIAEGTCSYEWFLTDNTKSTETSQGAASTSATSFAIPTSTTGLYYYFCRVYNSTDNSKYVDSDVATVRVVADAGLQLGANGVWDFTQVNTDYLSANTDFWTAKTGYYTNKNNISGYTSFENGNYMPLLLNMGIQRDGKTASSDHFRFQTGDGDRGFYSAALKPNIQFTAEEDAFYMFTYKRQSNNTTVGIDTSDGKIIGAQYFSGNLNYDGASHGTIQATATTVTVTANATYTLFQKIEKVTIFSSAVSGVSEGEIALTKDAETNGYAVSDNTITLTDDLKTAVKPTTVTLTNSITFSNEVAEDKTTTIEFGDTPSAGYWEGTVTIGATTWTVKVPYLTATPVELSWSRNVDFVATNADIAGPIFSNSENLEVNSSNFTFTVTGTEGLLSVTTAGVVTIDSSVKGEASVTASCIATGYAGDDVSYTIRIADAATKWDFAKFSETLDDYLLQADVAKASGNLWTNSATNRFATTSSLDNAVLTANGYTLGVTEGLKFTVPSAGNLRLDKDSSKRMWIAKDVEITIPNCKAGQVVTVNFVRSGSSGTRELALTNLSGGDVSDGKWPSGSSAADFNGIVSADGDVTMKASDGLNIYKITITDPVTLNANGYATYSKATDFTFSGAKAYKMNLNYTGGTLVGTEVTGKIKAGEGILFKGEAGAKVSIIEAKGAEALTDNSLVGTTPATGDAPAPDYTNYQYFVLKGKTFVPYTTATTFGAGKAFFQVAKNVQLTSSLELVFDGEATAINNVNANDNANNAGVKKYFKNGQLVIETANGVFTAAGAQVK